LGLEGQFEETLCDVERIEASWFALSKKSPYLDAVAQLDSVLQEMLDDDRFDGAKRRALESLRLEQLSEFR